MWIGLAIALVILWVIAFIVLHVTSFLIHLLLLIAVNFLIVQFARRNRGAP
jgi:hypothetical protein